MRFDKLVRDRIPEIIKKSGKMPKTRILSDAEYAKELAKKLVEEANEFTVAETTDRELEELADIQEVILAELKLLGKTQEDLEKVRSAKVAKRGGFEKRIFLEEASND